MQGKLINLNQALSLFIVTTISCNISFMSSLAVPCNMYVGGVLIFLGSAANLFTIVEASYPDKEYADRSFKSICKIWDCNRLGKMWAGIFGLASALVLAAEIGSLMLFNNYFVYTQLLHFIVITGVLLLSRKKKGRSLGGEE